MPRGGGAAYLQRSGTVEFLRVRSHNELLSPSSCIPESGDNFIISAVGGGRGRDAYQAGFLDRNAIFPRLKMMMYDRRG